MRKIQRLLTVGAALLLALGAWYIWPTPYRDFTLRAGPVVVPQGRVLAARQHRFTREVDVLTRNGWHSLRVTSGLTTGLDSLRALATDSTTP